MDVEKFLTAAIPQEIREIQHQDGELIRAVLVSAISAYHESDGMRDVTIARDIHKSLMVTLQSEILPHLAKEDEDWNGLKAKADSAPPLAVIEEVTESSPGVDLLYAKVSDGREVFGVVTRRDGEYTAVLSTNTGKVLGKSSGGSFQSAVKDAFSSMGVFVSSVSEPGAQESEDASVAIETTADTDPMAAERMDLEAKVASLVSQMNGLQSQRDFGRSKKARAEASAAYESAMKTKVGLIKRLREIRDSAGEQRVVSTP